MRITSKGQVTIPIEIRRQLGLVPESEVVFEIDGNTARLRKLESASPNRGERLVREMRGRATLALTTDDILALTRGGS